MTINRAIYPSAVKEADSTVGPREIVVIASTSDVDRMGDILEPAGARLEAFKRNPVVLASHDHAQPIARATSIAATRDRIVARIAFPAPGVNAESDRWLALTKSGIISAVSVGFLPLASEPLRGGGRRYVEWELLEISLVAVPANAAALVAAKTLRPRLAAASLRLRRLLAGL